MIELFITMLAAYGVTLIITEGTIFDGPKEKLEDYANSRTSHISHKFWSMIRKLLNCPMCTGFHVGWILGIFYGPFTPLNVILNGAFYAAIIWIIHRIIHIGDSKDEISD